MSYVFSKALRETPEEREKRLAEQRARWALNNANHYNSHRPPPVAAKPIKPVSKEVPEKSTPKPVEPAPSARRLSLPARTCSLDNDYGTAPKMGGAFARLAAQMEAEPTGIYTDVYEAYKARRSLQQHGVLPTNMRGDEKRVRKYSLDKDNLPLTLPKPLISATSRRDVFARNRSLTTPTSPSTSLFSTDVNKNRSASTSSQGTISEDEELKMSLSTPTTEGKAENIKLEDHSVVITDEEKSSSLPTPENSNDQPTEAKKVEKSLETDVVKDKKSLPLTQVKQDICNEQLPEVDKRSPEVISVKAEAIPSPMQNSQNIPNEQIPVADKFENSKKVTTMTDEATSTSTATLSSTSIFNVDPAEIEKVEKSPEVIAMMEEIEREKNKLDEGKQNLSQTIDELENFELEDLPPTPDKLPNLSNNLPEFSPTGESSRDENSLEMTSNIKTPVVYENVENQLHDKDSLAESGQIVLHSNSQTNGSGTSELSNSEVSMSECLFQEVQTMSPKELATESIKMEQIKDESNSMFSGLEEKNEKAAPEEIEQKTEVCVDVNVSQTVDDSEKQDQTRKPTEENIFIDSKQNNSARNKSEDHIFQDPVRVTPEETAPEKVTDADSVSQCPQQRIPGDSKSKEISAADESEKPVEVKTITQAPVLTVPEGNKQTEQKITVSSSKITIIQDASQSQDSPPVTEINKSDKISSDDSHITISQPLVTKINESEVPTVGKVSTTETSTETIEQSLTKNESEAANGKSNGPFKIDLKDPKVPEKVTLNGTLQESDNKISISHLHKIEGFFEI